MRVLIGLRSVQTNDLSFYRFYYGNDSLRAVVEGARCTYPVVKLSKELLEVDSRPTAFMNAEQCLEITLSPFDKPLTVCNVKDFVSLPMKIVALSSRGELLLIDALEKSIDSHRIDPTLANNIVLIPRDHNHEILQVNELHLYKRIGSSLRIAIHHDTLTLFTRTISRSFRLGSDLSLRISGVSLFGDTLALWTRDSEVYTLGMRSSKLRDLGPIEKEKDLRIVAGCSIGALLLGSDGTLYALIDGSIHSTGIKIEALIHASSWSSLALLVAQSTRGTEVQIFDFENRLVMRIPLSSECRFVDLNENLLAVSSSHKCVIYEIDLREKSVLRERTVYNAELCILAGNRVVAYTRDALIELNTGDSTQITIVAGYGKQRAVLSGLSLPIPRPSIRPLHSIAHPSILNHILQSNKTIKRIAIERARSLDRFESRIYPDEIVVRRYKVFSCSSLEPCIQPLIPESSELRIPMKISMNSNSLSICFKIDSSDPRSLSMMALVDGSWRVVHKHGQCFSIPLTYLGSPILLLAQVSSKELVLSLSRLLLNALNASIRRESYLSILSHLCRLSSGDCVSIEVSSAREHDRYIVARLYVRNECSVPLMLSEPDMGTHIQVPPNSQRSVDLVVPLDKALFGAPFVVITGCGFFKAIPLRSLNLNLVLALGIKRALKVLNMLGT